MKRAAYVVVFLVLGAGFAACGDARDTGGAGITTGSRADGTPTDESLRNEYLADECATVAPVPPIPLSPSTAATRAERARSSPERDWVPSEVSVVAVGDSLTFGQGSRFPGGDTGYPAVLGHLLGSAVVNRGVPGLATKELPDVDYLFVPGKQNRLVVMAGTNDIHGGLEATAADTYARLASYVAARRAAGWLVTVVTPTRWLAATPSTDRVAMEYEAMIRAGFPHVADAAASPLIGRSANGPDRAYYSDEFGHLNDAGYAELARVVKASPPPRGDAPRITPSMGIPRNKSLTAWFRDEIQCAALPRELVDRPAEWLNMAEPVFRGNFDAFGSDRPSRVLNAINGRPALRFNGPKSGFYVPMDRLTRNFIRASELVISVVMKIERITGIATAPYDNDGVFSDAGTRLGMSVKLPNIVTAFTYDGTRWASRDSVVPVGSPVVVSMRLVSGKLGLRVNTTGEWSETPAGNIDQLSNALHIGTDSTTDKTFSGLIADLVIRKSYCDRTMAADDAYFRARYGVP